MSKFHSLKIKEVRAETRDAVSIAFDVPADLADSFRFQHGQHLVMRTRLDGEEVRRSYSICSGVNDGELRVAIKRVPGGSFSAYANEALKVGASLEFMPPAGHFNVPLDPARHGNYLAVAAGSSPVYAAASSRAAHRRCRRAEGHTAWRGVAWLGSWSLSRRPLGHRRGSPQQPPRAAHPVLPHTRAGMPTAASRR